MSSVPQSSVQQRSLYRRHRPRTFDDVVGQESVVRTLRNAVELDRVHHAYLFVGSRGTGKTSIAKILAASLNCERGRSANPCGVCESCVAIAEARSLDVIEMDAASHNSVEDIRDLRESVAFQPLSGRTKVYILDEAHMLSNAAWNAFLKTLEEPPPTTVFVMATTEAQKVPATVIDRCHRFDFQRPTVEQVAKVIARTAESESIAIPAEAIAALAKSANGSFRDALGALEQIVTYGGEEVSLQDVLAVLGVADSELVEETLDAVATGDARAALLAVQRCVEAGRDVGTLAAELESRARELIVVQVLGQVPKELALTDEHDEQLAEQARRIDQRLLARLIDLLGFATQVTKAGGDARTQLELALLKATRPEVDPSTKALLARIERLETSGPALRAQAAGGEPIADTAATPRSDSAPEADRNTDRDVAREGSPGIENGTASDRAPYADRTSPATSAPGIENGSVSDSPPQVDRPAAPPEGSPGIENDTATQSDVVADATGANVTGANVTGANVTGADVTGADVTGADAADDLRAGALGVVAKQSADGAEDAPIRALSEAWPAIVDLVREGNALLGAVIAESVPHAIVDGELTVAFPQSSSFNKRKAESAAYKATLNEAISTLTGQRLRLAYELREDVPSPDDEDRAAGAGGEDDLVRRIIVEFDAEELPEGWAPGSSETEEGR